MSARFNTHAPISGIKPLLSASGINTSGVIISSSHVQRSRASTDDTELVLTSMIGW